MNKEEFTKWRDGMCARAIYSPGLHGSPDQYKRAFNEGATVTHEKMRREDIQYKIWYEQIKIDHKDLHVENIKLRAQLAIAREALIKIKGYETEDQMRGASIKALARLDVKPLSVLNTKTPYADTCDCIPNEYEYTIIKWPKDD